MTPQEIAKSIADELRANPSAWMQDDEAYAHDVDGNRVDSLSESAVCWCFYGLIDKRTGRYDTYPNEFYRALPHGFHGLSDWSDKFGRTVEDVIALCDKVAQS